MSYTPGPYSVYRDFPSSSPKRMGFSQSGVKQPQPINRGLVLPYARKQMVIDTIINTTSMSDFDYRSIGIPHQVFSTPRESLAAGPLLRATTNKAYERFVNKMHDTAELGITIATSRMAIDMITSRAVQLRRGYSSLRKGRFREFLRTFGLRPLPKHKNTLRTRPKEASGLWLEYWFGWTPLISDIHAAVDVLQSDYPDDFVFATSKQSDQFKRHQLVNGGTPWEETYDDNYELVVSTRIQANVTVENPNVYRANQLGLINPAVVVWDVIPFSFVIDWFTPVGNFLRSLSEFAGLKIENGQHYQKVFLRGSYTQTIKGSGRMRKAGVDVFVAQRILGIPSYQITPPHVKLPSATRAATAISLLVQLFIKP